VKNEWRKSEPSTVVTATEEMRNGDEYDGAKGCGGERVPETSAENLQLHKDPPANERANDSQNDVRDAAEAAATRDLSRKPSGNQTDQQPADDSAGVLEIKDMFIEKNGGHWQNHCASCKGWIVFKAGSMAND